MKYKKKEIRLLFGILLKPLVVGKPATIVHTGGWMKTTPVKAITRLTTVNVVFETENSVYCIVPYQHPAASKAPAMPTAA